MRDIEAIRSEEKRCVLFSVFRPENGDRLNARYHQEAAEVLDRFKFSYAEVVGCYEGEKEKTFLVVTEPGKDYSPLLNLAAQYKQDSVLILEPAGQTGRNARLIADLSASRTEIARGPFYATSRDDALSRIAWTFQPQTSVYYVADLEFHG